jgi:hypothetical protein
MGLITARDEFALCVLHSDSGAMNPSQRPLECALEGLPI